MTEGAREGNNALQLIKRTEKDTSGQIYSFVQQIPRLEKGRTYKISFYYKVPEEARGRGENCPLPSASFEFNSLAGLCTKADFKEVYPDFNSHEKCLANNQTWTPAPKLPRFDYTAESDWKKVEVLYTVPLGLCSDAGYKDKVSCEKAGKIWQELENLQDFELILFSPLNQNCPDSYVLYDRVEVKDNTEDSYFVIDEGSNLDRSSCTAVNWDTGCVEFLNTGTDNFETLKVKNDRNCEEWAVCTSYCSDPQYKTESDCKANQKVWNPNQCTATDLCIKEEGGVCTKFAAKKDNVRYDFGKTPLIIERVNDFESQRGYIYRFGTGGLSRISQWRAGDYSGYTIPDRFPLEKEVDLQFATYPALNDISLKNDLRYTAPICKIFPTLDAPLPFALSSEQGFENLQNLYSQSKDLQTIGNGCFFEQAEATGFTTNFPRRTVKTADNPTGIERICTAPLDLQGKICTDPARDCQVSYGEFSTSACNKIEKIKEFIGLEGMCLEFDTLNPIFGKVYQGLYGEQYNYQPYACLTYYPFIINLCPLHDEIGCKLNSTCSWDNIRHKCEQIPVCNLYDSQANCHGPFCTWDADISQCKPAA
jgi:hypothetical protein